MSPIRWVSAMIAAALEDELGGNFGIAELWAQWAGYGEGAGEGEFFIKRDIVGV